MAENIYTTQKKSVGENSRVILDAGLDVFSLQLLIESFTKANGENAEPVEFTYLGVDVRLQIHPIQKSVPKPEDAPEEATGKGLDGEYFGF